MQPFSNIVLVEKDKSNLKKIKLNLTNIGIPTYIHLTSKKASFIKKLEKLNPDIVLIASNGADFDLNETFDILKALNKKPYTIYLAENLADPIASAFKFDITVNKIDLTALPIFVMSFLLYRKVFAERKQIADLTNQLNLIDKRIAG